MPLKQSNFGIRLVDGALKNQLSQERLIGGIVVHLGLTNCVIASVQALVEYWRD